MRGRGFKHGPYVVTVQGLSHVATLGGVEVAYSQSKAGIKRALKGHREGQMVKDQNGVDWTKGAYAS